MVGWIILAILGLVLVWLILDLQRSGVDPERRAERVETDRRAA